MGDWIVIGSVCCPCIIQPIISFGRPTLISVLLPAPHPHHTHTGLARGAAVVMASSAAAAEASPAALAVQRLAFATASIVRVQGLGGLYSGIVPNMLQVLPSAALSYFTFETMKQVLRVVQE